MREPERNPEPSQPPNGNIVSMQEWMEYFKQATNDVASSALRFDPKAMPATAAGAPPPPVRPGAYISIVSEQTSMNLGLATSRDGCQALARGLLGLHSSHGPLSEAEVGDAVSEVVNIIAGKVKSRMTERDDSLQLGFPMFVNGEIQMLGGMEREVADVNIGPVPCQLLVFRRPKAA
jgi:Chemotaxis phosphatase CheX